LNTLNFTDGNTGTSAMTFNTLHSNGMVIAAVNDRITGGKINQIWLENGIKFPNVGALTHHLTQLKV
jgi:hypothetical protein